MKDRKKIEKLNAWNPGLESSIPARLMPLATLFRPECAHVSYEEASELSSFTGIKVERLASFRVERLVQHEILIRVTADLTVPDGPNYEVLGINLRSMVATIYDRFVLPEMEAIRKDFDELKNALSKEVLSLLDESVYARVTPEPEVKEGGLLSKLFGSKKPVKKEAVSNELPEHSALAAWKDRLPTAKSPREKECLESLINVVGTIIGHRGRLVTGRELTAKIVVDRVSNRFGSKWVGERISDLFGAAVEAEEYRLIPPQDKPVVMNVKGASASGKSTVRPHQRQLAKRLGIPWEDFALISPDYWRKYLLDYERFGEDYKYVGMLTGQELEIIDKKLDHHMAGKAMRGKMSHLLIDRFRFDSFAPNNERSSDSKLLTRFGDRIFMFFMITPPKETVERAWLRGKTTGRYKAVDDLLYHNIEAYNGMPELFFSWALSPDKTVHYEFLDNDVPLGELPKTVAFGWNGKMTILDVERMIDVDRFKKVNIEAKSPNEVFDDQEPLAMDNLSFLNRCLRLIPEVTFADRKTGRGYAKITGGSVDWCDEKYLASKQGKELRATLEKLGFDEPTGNEESAEIDIEAEKQFTFGRWATGKT